MSEPFHQLAAVLFVDIVGYSSMMQKDEQSAVEKINHFRDVLEASLTEKSFSIMVMAPW
jgi:class 3 adenylate cyclase